MKKRVTLILLLLLSGMVAAAQNITFDLQPEGKGMLNADYHFVGCDDGHVVLIELGGRHTKRFVLNSYSLDQQLLASVDLGKEKDLDPRGGYINGQHVDLLQVAYPDNGMVVYRERRSLSTLQPEGDTLVLARYSGEKGDLFGCLMAESPNRELLAGAYVAYRKAQGMEVKVGLYNHEMEEYWTMTTDLSDIQSIYVNDEGEVVLYSLDKKGKCRFTVVDGERIENHEFDLSSSDPIVERGLVRFADGKILIAATVCEDRQTLMPQGSNIDCIDFYCYNTARKHLSVERYRFTNQEVNRLCNEKDDKYHRRNWIPFGELSQAIADKEGAYVVIDNAWTVTTNGIPKQYNSAGMMVMRVNADGKVLWTHAQRFFATSTNYSWRKYIIQGWLLTPDGIMLAWSDNAKNSSAPDDKPYKQYKAPSDKSTLNVLLIDKEGKASLSYINTNRMCTYGSVHRSNTPGKYVAHLRNMKKAQLAVISIEK